MSDYFEDLEEALEDLKLDFLKDKLDKIRSKPWAEKTGSILKKTGILIGAFGSVCPGVCIIAGALTFTAEVLDPSDLKLSKLKEDVAKMEERVQKSFNDISEDMHLLENDLKEVKSVMHETYALTLDQSYKKGMEMVEAAYINFLNGSHNLQGTFSLYQNYMVELQTTAILYLHPEKVKTYLIALFNSQGYDKARMAFEYAISVRGKYLQIVCAFYLFKNDQERVEKELDLFNHDFQELINIHKDLLQKVNSTSLALEHKSSDKTSIENQVQEDNLIKSIESKKSDEGMDEDQGRRISWFSWAKKKTTENLDQQETNVPDADKDKKNSWFTWTSKKTSIANETKKVKTINDAEESEKEKKRGKPKTNLTEKKSLVQTSNSLQIRHKPSRQRSMSDGCIFKGKILNLFI